ncbi:MAG: 2',3'-cyclic-nucleotide 2'-phosphodiesterase, partial [Bacteroidales bacterium]
YQKENHQRPNWLQPYKIIEKQLKNGKKIKIAFVGLTTTETPQKTNKENLENLEFIHPLGAAAIESLVELKKEGEVDMIVLLTHLGTNMDSIAIFEEQNAKLLPYLDNINAIITGHSHKVVLSEINHVPIIQANTNGTHIGKLQFEIKMNDKGKNEVRYIGGDTMKIQSRNFNSNIDSL